MRGRKQGADSALFAAAGMLLLALALHITDGALRRDAEPDATVRVEARQVNFGDEYLIYDIRTPVVAGFADVEFGRALNERIAAQIAQDKAEAESYAVYFYEQVETGRMWPYDCVFYAEYEVKCLAGILSLRVTTFLDNGGTGMPHTVYYNADIERCAVLSLDDLFSSDEYKERIGNVIDAQMRKNVNCNPPFKGLSDDTQFFISDGKLYIAFAKYEIASGGAGEPEFEIPADEITDLIRQQYRFIFR
jgi:hypothetical protein